MYMLVYHVYSIEYKRGHYKKDSVEIYIPMYTSVAEGYSGSRKHSHVYVGAPQTAN